MYTKLIELVEVNKVLITDLQNVQKQKESLEQRNYELMTQVKDVTERLNCVESNITQMNTGKADLDETLQVGQSTCVKTALGYLGESTNNVVSKSSNLKAMFRRTNMTS